MEYLSSSPPSSTGKGTSTRDFPVLSVSTPSPPRKLQDLPRALRLHALGPRRERLPEKEHELLTQVKAVERYATPALPEFKGRNLLAILTHPVLILIKFGFEMEVLSAPIQELLHSSQEARVLKQG